MKERLQEKAIPEKVNRRTLLKGLGTASGGLALTLMLPGKWIKPVIGIGVLPAHAQTSISSRQLNITSNRSWTVPDGVSSVTITANGAKGGDSLQTAGGWGGLTTATFPVSAGQVLAFFLGVHGGDATESSAGDGGDLGLSGRGNGGSGGTGSSVYAAGGGSMTLITLDGSDLMIVGGGGGAGRWGGGDGGYVGFAGTYIDGYSGGGGLRQGKGGSGTGGDGGGGTFPGEDGQDPSGSPAGKGGDGASGTYAGGGGGGGGYAGGGGASGHDTLEYSGGGGGGSSWLHATATGISGALHTNTDGQATLVW